MNKFYNNFSAGEWSPLLDARSDLEKYSSACKHLENFRVLPYGGVRYRNGFAHVRKLRGKSRLISFRAGDAVEAAPVFSHYELEAKTVGQQGPVALPDGRTLATWDYGVLVKDFGDGRCLWTAGLSTTSTGQNVIGLLFETDYSGVISRVVGADVGYIGGAVEAGGRLFFQNNLMNNDVFNLESMTWESYSNQVTIPGEDINGYQMVTALFRGWPVCLGTRHLCWWNPNENWAFTREQIFQQSTFYSQGRNLREWQGRLWFGRGGGGMGYIEDPGSFDVHVFELPPGYESFNSCVELDGNLVWGSYHDHEVWDFLVIKPDFSVVVPLMPPSLSYVRLAGTQTDGRLLFALTASGNQYTVSCLRLTEALSWDLVWQQLIPDVSTNGSSYWNNHFVLNAEKGVLSFTDRFARAVGWITIDGKHWGVLPLHDDSVNYIFEDSRDERYYDGGERLLVSLNRFSGDTPTRHFMLEAKRVEIPAKKGLGSSVVLALSDKYLTVFDAGGEVCAEFAAPWVESEIFRVQSRAMNDVIYLVHPQHPVHRLERHDDRYVFQRVEWDYPPVLDENVTELQLTLTDKDDTGPRLLASEDFFEAGHDDASFVLLNLFPAKSFSLSLGKAVNAQLYFKKVISVVDKVRVTFVGRAQRFVSVPVEEVSWERVSSEVYDTLPEDERRKEQTDSFSAGIENVSDEIFVVGKWALSTSNTWRGELFLERRANDGTKWESIRSWTSKSDRNVSDAGEQLDGAWFRLRFVSGGAVWGDDIYQGAKPTSYALANATLDIQEAYRHTRVEVVAVLDPRTCRVVVKNPDDAIYGQATDVWHEGAFSGKRGYPGSVAFHEQRLFFGGVASEPNRVWASVIDDFHNFRPGDEADSAVSYVFAASEQNKVSWMESAAKLLVMTTGRQFSVSSGRFDDPIEPGNISIRSELNNGGSAVEPVLFGREVLFTGRLRNQVYEISYDAQADGFVSSELSLLSRHLLASGVVQMVRADLPDSLVFCVVGDGSLAVLSYDRGNNVSGWSRWRTAGAFCSVASIRGEFADELWAVVERGDGGFFLERYSDESDEKADGVWLDGFFTFDMGGKDLLANVPVAVSVRSDWISGRAGMALVAVIDGRVIPASVNEAGTLTVARDCPDARTVSVGLRYVGKLQTMRSDVFLQDGWTQGRLRRIDRLVPYFYKTVTGKYGSRFDAMQPIYFRATSDATDATNPERTAEFPLLWNGGHDRDGSVCIMQDEPMPMTLRGLSVRLEVGG